jgi:hypothetical protein
MGGDQVIQVAIAARTTIAIGSHVFQAYDAPRLRFLYPLLGSLVGTLHGIEERGNICRVRVRLIQRRGQE